GSTGHGAGPCKFGHRRVAQRRRSREGPRMASRTSWEGYLRLNLLSVPVKAYNAAAGGSNKVGFHLIHEKCESRIHYKKVCPVHGEVPNDEIVSAYEFA